MRKSKKDWRDEVVPRSDFQCACGCELQLSRGDLNDAIRCALPFNGKPRTWGVELSNLASKVESRIDPPEPVKAEPCPSCDDPVEIPVYAAKLLRDQRAAWPKCSSCRTLTSDSRHARDHWE